MAELALKINDSGGYDDGDCLCSFNDRCIACVHMQHVCHKRLTTRNGSGLIEPDSLTELMLERVSQYKFVRVSNTERQRITIATSAVERRSVDPAAIAFQLRSGKLPMFGTAGREVWYGGHTDYSQAVVDDVWTEIESYEPPGMEVGDSYVPHQRSSFPYFPAGTDDLKEFLFIKVDDFNDATAKTLVEPLMKGEDVEKIRKHNVAWRSLSGVIEADVLDMKKTVDLRQSKSFVRADVLTTKTVSVVG